MHDRAAVVATDIMRVFADAGKDRAAARRQIEALLREEFADIERQVRDDIRLRDD